MCGIVGFSARRPTDVDLGVVRRVLIESRIRGMHASGIAWFDGEVIQSLIRPVPIDELMEEVSLNDLRYGADGSIALIAHARYSTSDIRYNQPLVGKHFAIAHNGVVSQADPATWEATYGLKCKTRNDSELLLRAMEAGHDPFQMFPDASIAMVTLSDKGEVTGRRNRLRPLWAAWVGDADGLVYGSTFSILHRAGVSDIQKLECIGSDTQRRDMTRWIQP